MYANGKTVLRNDVVTETEVNYIDQNQIYHIVWFEDPESRKQDFLKERGVSSFTYWAYGYFCKIYNFTSIFSLAYW